MTHTTTDAAEARALEVLKSVGERDCYRATDHLPHVPQDTAIAAMIAFATAEAASGVGEREAGEPTLAREIAAQFFDKRDPLDRSFRDIAHNIRRGRYDDQDSVEIVRFTLAFVARKAASLPPATDPAIPDGCKLVPVEPTGEMVVAALRSIEDTDPAGPSVWSAMLAAAPTIPATGEAIAVADAAMVDGETVIGWLKAEQDRLDAEGGDYLMDTTDCINVVRERSAALAATIPATGHAATEGEG